MLSCNRRGFASASVILSVVLAQVSRLEARVRHKHVLEIRTPNDVQGIQRSLGSDVETIVVNEDSHASTGEWSGNRVWPSAFALVDFLHRTRGKSLVGLRILELGCGLPFTGAALAALGAEVCSTDHPDALPLAEAALVKGPYGGEILGLSLLARQRLRVRPLAWGNVSAMTGKDYASELCGFGGPIDLVVGADLVYHDFPLEPLQETLSSLLSVHGATAVLALQPRRFPMTAALSQPKRVPGFLKSFAALGDGWEVSTSRPGLEASAQLGEEAVDGLVLATIISPRARRNSIVDDLKSQLAMLRYSKERLKMIQVEDVAADTAPRRQGTFRGEL